MGIKATSVFGFLIGIVPCSAQDATGANFDKIDENEEHRGGPKSIEGIRDRRTSKIFNRGSSCRTGTDKYSRFPRSQSHKSRPGAHGDYFGAVNECRQKSGWAIGRGKGERRRGRSQEILQGRQSHCPAPLSLSSAASVGLRRLHTIVTARHPLGGLVQTMKARSRCAKLLLHQRSANRTLDFRFRRTSGHIEINRLPSSLPHQSASPGEAR